MNSTVDVLSLTYNQAVFIPSLFESIISQTYRPLRLVLVNDCSIDATDKVVREYLPKLFEANIECEYILMPQNTKAIGAFDRGRENLTGEYVAFLDGDDFYKPTKIQESMEFLQKNPKYSMMHTDLDCLYESGEYQKEFWKSVGVNQGMSETSFEYLLPGNRCHTPTIVVKTEVYLQTPTHEEMNRRGYIMGDYPAWLWISKRYKIGYLDKSLSVYRVINKSKSHDPRLRPAFIEATKIIQRDAAQGKL